MSIQADSTSIDTKPSGPFIHIETSELADIKQESVVSAHIKLEAFESVEIKKEPYEYDTRSIQIIRNFVIPDTPIHLILQ